jgi:hypothetical protein
MNANQVKAALAARHKEDLYAEEVTCGPAGGLRLDAWAMPRSWANFETVGYEVKVTHADWAGDRKLGQYRDYVHRMWVACPWGLIQPEEIPEGVGLLWVAKTGTRAVCKRRAPELEAPKHTGPMISAFINRGEIVRGSRASFRFDGADGSAEQRRRIAREFLDGRITDRELGRELGLGIAKKLASMAKELEQQRRAAATRQRESEWLEGTAKSNGWKSAQEAASAKAGTGISGDDLRALQRLSAQIAERVDAIATKQALSPGFEAAG